MNPLSLEIINAKSPYKVWWHEKTKSYRFLSDSGVVFSIDFDEDDMISCCESYLFGISNVNRKSSPRDHKMHKTILTIIEEFFQENEAALLYICETGDGKQKMRNRLFSSWFFRYSDKNIYSLVPFIIEDEEGLENYAALILRKDNPRYVDIVSEFSYIVNMLNVKP